MKREGPKWFRLFSIVFVISLFITGSFALLQNTPRIEFESAERDFGSVKQGEILNHIFKFKNTGEVPLLIKRVRTTCGCTAALISDRTIAPGQKGEVKVAFNTTGYAGEIRKYIYVETNDPKEPNKQLSVVAEIDVPPHAEINLDRFTIDLGLILENEKIQTRVNIKNKGELELRVIPSHKNALFYVDGERVKSPIKIAAGNNTDLKIELNPKRQGGLLREYIMFKSNDPIKSSLSLYVSGYVVTKEQLRELFNKYRDIID
jgi:hypothetical protein